MTTTLEHGITIMSDAVGSIIQKCSVEEIQEESDLKGMNTATSLTQIVKTWTHSKQFKFSANGSGDLTLATGTGATSTFSLFSGGINNILSFKYDQELGKPSNWSYSGNNKPYAS